MALKPRKTPVEFDGPATLDDLREVIARAEANELPGTSRIFVRTAFGKGTLDGAAPKTIVVVEAYDEGRK